MFRHSIAKYFWWLIEGELAGMPLPFVDPERSKRPSSHLTAFDDDLRFLHDNGIRSIVSLVKGGPSYDAVLGHLGFKHLFLPIEDGKAPTPAQVGSFAEFYRTNPRPCAVHCEGGVGRTGTLLAAFLIHEGAAAGAAIAKVRVAQPAAIESATQVRFLKEYGALMDRAMVELACTAATFKPIPHEAVRWLKRETEFSLWKQYHAAHGLFDTVPAHWEEAHELGYRYAVLIQDRKVVSLAAAWMNAPDSWELAAVSTLPECCSRGYSRQVCSFVTAHILSQKPRATCHTRHPAMIKVAEAIGYLRTKPAR